MSPEKSEDGLTAAQPASTKFVSQDGEHTEEQSIRKTNSSRSSDPPLSSTNPFAQLGAKGDVKSVVRGASTPGRPLTPMKRERPPSASGGYFAKTGESLGAWEDRVLSTTFRLTLDPAIIHDSGGNRLHFVAGVRSDLEEQHQRVMFTTAILDQAILEAASGLEEKVTPLDYLLGCWKRIIQQLRNFKGPNAEESKLNILKEAKRLCMSYCCFAITIPEMFG